MVRPCAYFNALLLIRHAQGNFIQEGMNLRMIYDWAVLLRAEQDNLDWIQLYADFETCGLRIFVDVMTSICVDYLGTELTCKDITLCTNKKMCMKSCLTPWRIISTWSRTRASATRLFVSLRATSGSGITENWQ